MSNPIADKAEPLVRPFWNFYPPFKLEQEEGNRQVELVDGSGERVAYWYTEKYDTELTELNYGGLRDTLNLFPRLYHEAHWIEQWRANCPDTTVAESVSLEFLDRIEKEAEEYFTGGNMAHLMPEDFDRLMKAARHLLALEVTNHEMRCVESRTRFDVKRLDEKTDKLAKEMTRTREDAIAWETLYKNAEANLMETELRLKDARTERDEWQARAEKAEADLEILETRIADGRAYE